MTAKARPLGRVTERLEVRSPPWGRCGGMKGAGVGRGLHDGQEGGGVCWGRGTQQRYKCRLLGPMLRDRVSRCGWDQKLTFHLGPPWL